MAVIHMTIIYKRNEMGLCGFLSPKAPSCGYGPLLPGVDKEKT